MERERERESIEGGKRAHRQIFVIRVQSANSNWGEPERAPHKRYIHARILYMYRLYHEVEVSTRFIHRGPQARGCINHVGTDTE